MKEVEKKKKKATPKKRTTKKSSKKGGRPSKLNISTVQKLVDIFRIDGTVEEACSQAEISTSTFYNYYDQDFEFLDNFGEKKSFRKAIDKAKEFPTIVSKKSLIKAAAVDPKYAIEFLKRRHKDYKDKAEVDNNHIIDGIKITLDE